MDTEESVTEEDENKVSEEATEEKDEQAENVEPPPDSGETIPVATPSASIAESALFDAEQPEAEPLGTPPPEAELPEGSDFVLKEEEGEFELGGEEGTAVMEEEEEDAEGVRQEEARGTQEEDDRRISGDFKALPAEQVASRASIESYKPQAKGESLASIPEEREEPEPLDRQPYYELHDLLGAELTACKIKNNFLHRKMAEYFRKRKMEHVLKETDQQVDTQHRYAKRLDALHELLERDGRQRTAFGEEVEELRRERDEKLEFIRGTFRGMTDREREVGSGLIYTKTGKQLPDKLVERLLRRQALGAEQVAELRLRFIKVRNRVAEKQEALQAVDRLGDNLRLVDFEQLKAEYRGYADKVEERDEELTKLRSKCDEVFQVLAHLREKSASATIDIMKEKEVLKDVEMEFVEARERTNHFKLERDRHRSLIGRLREDTGLLLRPKLLADMEEAVEEAAVAGAELADLAARQREQTGRLRAIRRNIEAAAAAAGQKKGAARRGGAGKVRKGRPGG